MSLSKQSACMNFSQSFSSCDFQQLITKVPAKLCQNACSSTSESSGAAEAQVGEHAACSITATNAKNLHIYRNVPK